MELKNRKELLHPEVEAYINELKLENIAIKEENSKLWQEIDELRNQMWEIQQGEDL